MIRESSVASKSPVPNESVATPADVRKALQLTPEKVEELRREQSLELYRSRARLSPEERQMARGVELEQHHRQTGDVDGLAEALRQQGRYREAADMAVSDVLKKECREYAEAVDKEDASCSCDGYEVSGDYAVPNEYIESFGYSQKHGAFVPFIRCKCCGELNARPEPEHLAEQREMRHSDSPESEKRKFFKV